MLKLSNLADYGVVVMNAAAREASGGRPVSAARLASRTGLPTPTVSKLLGHLVRAGLLSSQRGVAGGFILNRAPDEITLADIVEAIDGPIALTNCGEQANSCNHVGRCSVQPHWAPVNEAVKSALAGVSLATLAPGGQA